MLDTSLPTHNFMKHQRDHITDNTSAPMTRFAALGTDTGLIKIKDGFKKETGKRNSGKRIFLGKKIKMSLKGSAYKMGCKQKSR